MIRSSKLSTKFSNQEKKNQIKKFIHEYKNVMQQCLNLTWEKENLKPLAGKEITNQIKTWLSARAIQCACKQAIAIVKGTKQKNKQRQYVIDQLISKNFKRKARSLQKRLIKTSKPTLNNVQPELDSRFVKFDFDNETSFDGWVTLSSLGNKLKIILPIKKTKHFNSMQGELKSGVRLSNKSVTLMFESEIELKDEGEVIGLDIGISTLATTSDHQITQVDEDGWDLTKIIKRLNRKKKGSKGYERVQRQRTNFINWSINQLNFKNVRELKLENIKHVRKGKRTSQFLNRWTYTEIKRKLELTCEKFGVQITYVNPTYTSQRCNECGWVRSSNRKGKLFKCGKCSYECDADLNGAKNIVANLSGISTKERLLHKNRIGFYWNEVGQESIVPVAPNHILI